MSGQAEALLHERTYSTVSIHVRRLLLAGFLGMLLVLALAIRADDITDLPLDFHPARQLYSALIARGMYLQSLPADSSIPEWKRRVALVQWQSEDILEPRIMETLTVAGYRLAGSEQLWIPRLLSALFWVLGALPLFWLARAMTSTGGALVAAIFYLFLPYAIVSSRSFQPDPLMVAMMTAALWAMYRWRQTHSWPWAMTAGLLSGAAIFVKVLVVFPLAGGTLGLLIGARQLRKTLSDRQAWTIALLAGVPNLIYLVDGYWISGFLAHQSGGRFIPSLLLSPVFYLRWENKISLIMGHTLLVIALTGLLLINSRIHRGFLLGLWGSYLVFGLIFNHHISTHDYYSMPLIPIAALSLANVGELVLKRVEELAEGRLFLPLAVSTLALVGVVLVAWDQHVAFKSVDFRPQAQVYENVAASVGRKASVVALTDNYGCRLAYWGWINAAVWPSYGDLNFMQQVGGSTPSFAKLFKSYTAGKDFFVVTWFEELDYQPELRARLYSGYPVYAQGDGYVIFDLKHPIQ